MSMKNQSDIIGYKLFLKSKFLISIKDIDQAKTTIKTVSCTIKQVC